MLKTITKKDIAIVLGTLFDHADSALYGFLAPIMAPLFFPHYDPMLQLILGYSVYATSIITRPLGAFIFSYMADTQSAALALAYCLWLLTVTSIMLGCLPTYAAVGWFAPFSLIVVRMAHSACAAGYSSIAKVYIIQNKEIKQAYMTSNFYQCISIAGILLASYAAAFVVGSSNPQLFWRLCYVVSGMIGFVIYYLLYPFIQKDGGRTSFTNLFKEVKKQHVSNQLTILWNNRTIVTRIALVTGFSYCTYSIPFVFLTSFIPKISAISLKDMMLCTPSLLWLDMLLIFLLSPVLLKCKPKSVMASVAIALAVTTIPLFYGLPGATWYYVLGIRCWILVGGVIFLCAKAVWQQSLGLVSNHYFILTSASTIGAGLIGRTLPAICLSLWYITNSVLAPACYISILMVLTAWAVRNS